MGTGDLRQVPPGQVSGPDLGAPGAGLLYATGEPDKVQGRDNVGIVEGSRGHEARGVRFRG